MKQLLYKEMLGRYEMAKVTGKLVRYEGPDKIKTIERAFSPTHAINTPIILTIIIALILGVVAGVAVIFVSVLLDSGVKDVRTVEQLTGAKVLAVMPLMAEPAYDNLNQTKHDFAENLSRGNND